MIFFYALLAIHIFQIWRVRKLAQFDDIELIRSFVRKVYISYALICLCAAILYALSNSWWPFIVFLVLFGSAIWNYKYPDILLRAHIFMNRHTKALYSTKIETPRNPPVQPGKDQYSAPKDDYMSTIRDRFLADGYDIEQHVICKQYKSELIAKNRRFRTDLLSLWETFYIVTEFSSIDADTLRNYSSICRSYAKRHKLVPFLPLTGGVFCCPVAIAKNIEPSAMQALQDDGPRISVGFTTIPVIIDIQNKEPLYSDKEPFRGTLVLGECKQNIHLFFSQQSSGS